ncbi:unnamed protein product [Wuchereria bancrofti]|uniref:Domain of unknown function DB domain-containing protein n=1 Tax=Wuchereria bancrofti TaxID=6293 RepID=A0A3P7GMU0_WUCBA|nr:unnamed protein product [Wuchereria bancrofti]
MLSTLDNDQEWSKGSQSMLDSRMHDSSSLLVPFNQFKYRKSKPLRALDERRALAMVSPTAAELPIKGRTFQLILMYLHQDSCPINAMKEMQFCAAQGRDHRPCCLRNGITTTIAGAKCLTFCDQRPGQITHLDTSFLPCFDRFENMKSCFWHDIIRYFRRF